MTNAVAPAESDTIHYSPSTIFSYDINGNTILYNMIKSGNLFSIKKIDSKYNLANYCNINGVLPVFFAALFDKPEIFDYLLARTLKQIMRITCFTAISPDYTISAKYIIAILKHCNDYRMIYDRDTLLQSYISTHNLCRDDPIFCILLEKCNINHNNDKNNIMTKLCQLQNWEIISWLLDTIKFEINVLDVYGNSVVNYFIMYRQTGLIEKSYHLDKLNQLYLNSYNLGCNTYLHYMLIKYTKSEIKENIVLFSFTKKLISSVDLGFKNGNGESCIQLLYSTQLIHEPSIMNIVLEQKMYITDAELIDMNLPKTVQKKISPNFRDITRIKSDFEIRQYYGLDIDAISGLLYLNQIFKSIGFVSYLPVDIEFDGNNIVNYDIMWNISELKIPPSFPKFVQKHTYTNYIFVLLTIETTHGFHQNTILIDFKNHEITRFEPNGSFTLSFYYSPSKMDDKLKSFFAKLLPDLKYIEPKQYSSYIGLQKIEAIQKSKKRDNIEYNNDIGYCLLICFYWITVRVANPTLSNTIVYENVANTINFYSINLHSLIEAFSAPIIEFRDKLLGYVGETINSYFTAAPKTMNAVIDIIHKLFITK